MNHQAQAISSVEELISELNATLAAERQALTRLDHAAVAACAEQKLKLAQSLKSRMADLDPGQDQAVAKLQRAVRLNQVLLIHARDQVAGTLQLLRGEPPGHRSSGSLPAQGLCLDFRG